jgi:hypothetical protein
MTSLASAGLALLASFCPTAGYTAVVINKLILEDSANVTEIAKLGIAGILVAAVTAPMVRWVLNRLGKVSDDLIKSKDDHQSRELKDIQAALKQHIDHEEGELREIRRLLENVIEKQK